MNNEILPATIYRDRLMSDRASVSSREDARLCARADHELGERCEVLLRLLLVGCVGGALMAAGATTLDSARLANAARPRAATVEALRVAAAGAASAPLSAGMAARTHRL